MSNYFKPLTAILLLSALACLGCDAKPSNKGKTLATFDGGAVTDKQFLSRYNALPKEVKSFAASHKKEFLEDMVSERYLLKEAGRRKIEKDPEVADLIESAKKKILIAKLIETEVDKKIKLSSSDAEDYYNTHKEEFVTPLTLRASHILVKTEEEAVSVRTSLANGADFEDLARKTSLDATAIRGGDLGFFQKGQFIPEFEEAILALKKGELSQPIKTRFGYHIIKLTDRFEPTLRSFDTVKQVIEQRLLNTKRSRTFKEYVASLRGSEKVHVDEKALEAVETSL